MVSDLMSFMTTSSLPRVRLRMKAPEGWSLPNTSGAKPCPGNRFTPAGGSQSAGVEKDVTDSHRSGTKQRLSSFCRTQGRAEEQRRRALLQIPTISIVAATPIFTAMAIRPQRNVKKVAPGVHQQCPRSGCAVRRKSFGTGDDVRAVRDRRSRARRGRSHDPWPAPAAPWNVPSDGIVPDFFSGFPQRSRDAPTFPSSDIRTADYCSRVIANCKDRCSGIYADK